ncbi:MAG: protein translocase subunit SecD [Anaerolineae bacterium]|nr:protein translocase subunit SecD [Anaerolineae bacterium]
MVKNNDYFWLFMIITLAVLAVRIIVNENYPLRLGLDLQGGLQVLLEADVPPEEPITAEQMQTVRRIIDDRVNGFGVAESNVQVEGDRRLVVELPGIDDERQALELIQGTALLEFVDTGNFSLPPEECVRTSLNEGKPSPCELEGGRTITDTLTFPAPQYNTVITGDGIANAVVEIPNPGRYIVAFDLNPAAAQLFEAHTRANVGRFLTIVLDKRVISSPEIQAVISNQGSISGNFTLEEAQTLALQLRYGSLPIPLKIVANRQVGATLGTISAASSIRAGTIGLVVVLLFMAIYYRLPGFLADIALLFYVLLNFAIFKYMPVTLTLPAIAGFLLSTGMAVDANILVFERIKEELRRGFTLPEAIVAGFDRAWSSIRDSNVATLIICLILFGFGRNFGASMVQGFAITLAIGVFISMFTAVIVTRTLVRFIMGSGAPWLEKHRRGLIGL